MREALDEGWADDGAMRLALEKRLEEGWAPGGVFRRMVEVCVEINQ